MSRKTYYHLTIVFLAALAVNMLPVAVGRTPLKYQLSSDAEIHVVFWQKYSQEYRGNFENDEMFNLHQRASGDLLANKIIVRVLDSVGVDVLTGSIFVSALALAIFLSGVYAVVAYSLKNQFLALLVALGSIVPAHTLGGSSWGFFANGYLPRDLAAAIAVWILLLYFHSIESSSKRSFLLVFVLAGLFANWYPVLFLHFAMVLLIAEIIRRRSISRDVIAAGFLFALCAIPAALDVWLKRSQAGPIDMALLHMKHRYMMFLSWYHTIFKYLRRVIIYGFLVGVFARPACRQAGIPALKPWYAILAASLIISITGIFIENYTPYAQFFFSRASLWFMFASMVILVSAIYEFMRRQKIVPIGAVTLLVAGLVFGMQSNAYQFARSVLATREMSSAHRQRIALYQKIQATTQPTDMILMDPPEANEVRSYAERSVAVSWKDGGVSLYDGRGARQWHERYQEVAAVFDSGDLETIKAYARSKSIRHIIYRGELISL